MAQQGTLERKKARARFKPKGRSIDESALDAVRELLGNAPRRRDLLIEYLHLIQDSLGHIPAQHLAALASEMKLSQAEVYEVATFYHHFDVIKEGETPPPPLTVRVCDGIACEMAGAKGLIDTLSDALGSNVRVKAAPCVGACDKAPVTVVGQRQVTAATTESVNAAVTKRSTTHPLPNYEPLTAYRAGGGYAIFAECLAGKRTRDDVLGNIETADLRGLGGAGFPTARKWRFLEGTGAPRYVAVNADEGEPGTFKDRHCFETQPHRVLEGALIAAWTVGAEAIFIYLRDEYPAIRALLMTEIAALQDAGLTGGIDIQLRRGAGAYICGEESAMLESIEGKRGLPRNRPPFPAQAGLWGRPTLINNVETLYWVPEILARGGQWYKDAGRPHFYSVSGRVNEPGVVLAPSGVTARELIDKHCGGMQDGHTFSAYLPGGASGGLLPGTMADLPLDFGTLAEYGCFIGSSAVVIFSDQDNIADICGNLLKFFEDESCGQCTPCRVGCEKMRTLLTAPEWDEALIGELSQAMADASICGLGQAAPNPVLSALRFFKRGAA